MKVQGLKKIKPVPFCVYTPYENTNQTGLDKDQKKHQQQSIKKDS